MKLSTNPALERDALYAKSQVYIRRGFRAQSEKDTEEYQLWASLALELLGKAALANVHPALVADPSHYQSIFAACGRPLSPDIKTIPAHTLFDRLGHIEKAFDSRHKKFCEQMALRRNAELHSGESPFSGMSSEAWEKEFWGVAEVVLKMQKESLESWLGTEDSKAPAKIIELAEEAMEWAVKHRVARCKEDFEKTYQDPKRRAAAVEDSKGIRWWQLPGKSRIEAEGHKQHTCPACGSAGVLAGDLWSEEVSDYEDPEDPTLEFIEQTYLSEKFLCPVCELRLFGTKEVQSAGLPGEFVEHDMREREFEPDYGND